MADLLALVLFFLAGFALVFMGFLIGYTTRPKMLMMRADPGQCPYCGAERFWLCVEGCQEGLPSEAAALKRWVDKGREGDG